MVLHRNETLSAALIGTGGRKDITMTDRRPWFLGLAAWLATAAPALAQQPGQQPPPEVQVPWLFIFLFLGLVALIVGAVTSRIFQRERKTVTVTRDLDEE